MSNTMLLYVSGLAMYVCIKARTSTQACWLVCVTDKINLQHHLQGMLGFGIN